LKSGAPLGRWPRAERTSSGVPYHIRPLRADDAQRERDFIRKLSPQSRYQRFMHTLREPSDALVDQLVHVDYRRTMALAALSGVGAAERIVGVARYAADSDTECEFAVAVADDWQCRGIGSRLAALLFDYAARAGFQTIYGTVLADNQRMIELAQWLGLTVGEPRPGESTIRAWRRLDSSAQ